MMKQSKYSKRRPLDSAAYRHTASSPAPVEPKKRPIEYLGRYEVGVFIDDKRELKDVNLPNADRWVVLRSYREVSDYFIRSGQPKAESMFISFDHYLDETDGNRFNGTDCMNICKLVRNNIAHRVDIQGHSADSSMNTLKVNDWYNRA